MPDNKKPGEPVEEERRVMEDEIRKIKRSNLILSVGLLLQEILYGILILRLILYINRIMDALLLISDTIRLLTDSHRELWQVLEIFKNPLL